MPLDRALAETAAARARLERIYGTVPPVVMFTQREEGGPVRIGRAQRLAGGVLALHAGDERPVMVRAVVPGGSALEAWHRRRAADLDLGRVIDDARAVGAMHVYFYRRARDITQATVRTLRAFDPFLVDFEVLYLNGATYADLAAHAGLTLRQVQATLDRMRALGFDMPHRRIYGKRAARA